MALIVVTGPMGAGKSYYAVRKAAEALESGRFVITNFRMTPDWHEKVVDHHPLRWLMPGRRRALKAEWARRVLVVKDLDELRRVRLAGEGEGRGIAIIDEGHVFMNAREWRDGNRKDIVDWMSATRKLGLDVYLITQDKESVDRQVRDRLTYHVTLRNLRQFKVLGVPIFPFNFFLAIWQYHAAGKAIVKREAYRLNWTRRLYDTADLSAFMLDLCPEDEIRLPRAAVAHPPTANALAGATGAAGAAAPRRDEMEDARRRLLDPDRYLRDVDRDATAGLREEDG